MKVKGKIKGIITILAALLCAAILAVVGTLFVKNNNSTQVADAAIAPTHSTISVKETKFAYKTGAIMSPKYSDLKLKSEVSATDRAYYDEFSATTYDHPVTNDHPTPNVNDQKLVLTKDPRDSKAKAMWADFTINIEVPRYTKYEIDYTFNMYGYKSSANGKATATYKMELYDFSKGHSGTTGVNAGSMNSATQFKCDTTTTCAQTNYGAWAKGIGGASSNIENNKKITGTYSPATFVCDNTSNSSSQTFSFKYGASALIGYNDTDKACLFYYEIVLDEDIKISETSKPTMGATKSYVYDGNSHPFSFTYDSTQIAVSKLTKTNLNGTTDTLYSYDTAAGTATVGTNPMVPDTGNTYKLNLTDVGKYEISFDLINGWVYDNPGHDQAIEKFTFYITPKKVNKPTDPNATTGLTYNFSPQTVTLGLSGIAAGNWATYIAVKTCPMGVTDKGGGSFDITDAGTYNLELELVDDTKTVWAENWDDTAWNPAKAGGTVTLPLKMNPKPVNPPTGLSSSTATYDGTAKTTRLNGWSPDMKDEVDVKVSGTGASVDTSDDSVRQISATNKGTYTITASLKKRADNGCNFIWSDTKDTADKTFNYNITVGGLTVPTLSGSSTETYKDGNGIDFGLNGFDTAKMKVVRPNGNLTSGSNMPMTWDDGLSFDGTKFTAKNAGTYNIEFALTDHDNTQWAVGSGTTANQSISFTVDKMTVMAPLAPSGTFAYTGAEQTANLTGQTKYHKLTVSGDTSSVDNTTGDIKFTNAGTYTVSVALADDKNTTWAGGTAPAPITFTVAPKQLKVKQIDNKLGTSWQAGTKGTIKLELSDCVATDTVILTVYYLDGNGAKVTPTASGMTDGSTQTEVSATLKTEDLAVGTYKLDAELSGSSAKNYAIDKATAGLPLTLTVTPESASTTLKWQYTINGANASPATTTGSGDSLTVDASVTKIAYKLNSDGTAPVEYEFKVDETQLPDGVLIDTDQYTGGYKDNKASTVGTYTAIVAIKCKDGFQFDGGSTKKDCKITFTIEKGKFDTTGIKWEYTVMGDSTPKEYTAAVEYAQKMYKLVVISDTLPKGLKTSGYKNCEKMPVGTYTAEVSFKCDDPNYDVPANLKLTWEIKAAEIKVDWDLDAEYPVLNDPRAAESLGIVKYTYYTDSALTTEIAKEDIVVDDTQQKTYYVKAEIAPAQSANYTITDPSGNNCITDFSVGGDKLPLTVQASFAGDDHYNGEAHAATVTFSPVSGLVEGTDYELHYYSVADDGTETPLDGAPVAAGKYCVKVTLKKSAVAYYTISGDKRFEFTIKKGVLDLSGLKWNYTEAFQYGTQDGTPIVHKVELEGLPEYLQGLVKYTGNEYSRYGKYSASFEFDGFDSINYEQLVYPEGFTAELKWEIGMRMLTKPTVKPRRAHYTGEELTAEIEGFDAEYMEIVSGELKGTEVGDYAVTVALKPNDYVRWEDNTIAPLALTFTIVSPGEPLDPDNPDNPPPVDNPDDPTPVDPTNPNTPSNPDNPSGGTTTDNNNGGGFTLPDGFPLWQVIVGGISTILIAVFIAIICSNISAAKEYKQKASAAYAGVMINGMLFGISDMWWKVIALSLAGVAVVLFIVALVTASAKKKARRFCEAEEKRLEKQRHDEEMKMLMMMMNGGKGGSPAYSGTGVDVEEIVTRVVTALLPTMQTTMQQLTAGSGGDYDDAELKRRMAESERKISEMQELLDSDDGFGDVIEVDMDELGD